MPFLIELHKHTIYSYVLNNQKYGRKSNTKILAKTYVATYISEEFNCCNLDAFSSKNCSTFPE